MSGSRRTGNPLHRLVSATWQRASDTSGVRSRWTLALIVMVCAALLAQGCDTTPLPHQKISVESPSPRTDNVPHVTNESWSGRALSVATSADGKRVYVGTTRGGVWRSDDTGLSWRQLTSPQPGDSLSECVDRATVEVGVSCALPPLTIVSLALSPRNPDLIFAAAANDIRITQRRDGIYRSNDGGGSWQLVFQFECGNTRVGAPTDVVFAPDDPFRLWASSECGVAYSEFPNTPKGGATSALPGVGTSATWHLVDLAQFGGDGNVSSLAVAPESAPGVRWVYACGPTQLYYSRDGGLNYIPDKTQTVSCGNTSDRYFSGSTSSSTSVAVVPGNPNQIYVAERYYSNGIAYFDLRTDKQSAKVHPDGTACLGVNESFANMCGGSLWLGVFDSTLQSVAPPRWTQVASPPWYAGNGSSTFSGSVGVLTQPAPSGSGYLVLFFDTDSLSVSNGVPTAASWRRLDGPNATDICDTSATTCNQSGAAMFIHPDPDAVAITPDFALTLQAVDASSSIPEIYRANTVVQSGSCHGLIFEVTDGGVYHSASCGRTWDQSRDLTTLGVGMISGVLQPGSDYPALYFNTFDNSDWTSLDKGLTWQGFQPACGDCDAMWTDPLQPDLMAAYTNDGRILIYKGANGRAPDPTATPPDVSVVAIPFPPTLGAYGPVVADWTRGVGAYRMPVLTLPTEQPAPYGDFVMVAPKSTNFPTDAQGNTDFTKVIPMTVWRYQGPADGTVGAWQQVGLDVPPGTSVIAAAGGHRDPVYYVADRVVVRGQVYNAFAQGNHLFRSHQTGGKLDGWDCIVPGPANPGVHDGQCAAPHPDATHPGQAWTFQSDPYNSQVVYVEDSDGIKVTTDGGASWRTDTALTAWLTGHGTIGPQCVGLFCVADPVLHELAHIEFVPNEPDTRFATGEEGVFFTTDADSSPLLGAHWHRLLSASALACAPNWSFFDPAPLGQRTLYVACTGRSLLSFVGIPRRADSSGSITIEEKPIKVQPGGVST